MVQKKQTPVEDATGIMDEESLLQTVKKEGVFSPYFQHLFMIGPITAETVAVLMTQLHAFNQSRIRRDSPSIYVKANPIVLHIHSPGGEVGGTLSFIRAIRSSSVPVIASIEGWCASAATMVACACHVVVAAPMSLYLVHQPSLGVEGTLENTKSQVMGTLTINDFIVELYQRKTGLPESEIRDHMGREIYMNADTILKKRFVDAVLEPANRARQLYLKAHPQWDLAASAAEHKSSFSRVFVTRDMASPQTGYYRLFDALRAPCGYTPKPLVLEFVGDTGMDAFTAFLYVNMLLLSPVPVYGVFTGSLVDSGVWFFLACHRRLAHPGSTIHINPRLLHMEWGAMYAVNRDIVANYKVWKERMSWFFGHIGVSSTVSKKLLNVENPTTLSYAQAVDMRIVDAAASAKQ